MQARKVEMQHIDRKALYTDLEARIHYLHSFLDFGSADIEHLAAGAKYIKVLIPAVTNIVYRKLLQYDITARAFYTRSTALEGDGTHGAGALPPLDEDAPQIRHRKRFLRAYLAALCTDPAEMSFWAYLDKVGMMHVGLGRAHPLHVEYVHVGMTLALIQDVLTEALLGHPRLSMARKVGLIKALGKVLWIQNDLFAKWYVRDGEEYTDGVDYAPALADKEGYLHGKKVLHDEDLDGGEEGGGGGGDDDDAGTVKGEENDGEKTEAQEAAAAAATRKPGAVPAGVCPFAGMSETMGGLSVSPAATVGEHK
ncbi:Globin [Niveomyces insectorum RCEF 264]|uniref:Globin n=1 Tax=Niveomyces insectorum RCEF 264 TaxID=1081102 RepID=A0A167N2P2_9HYPO|nr:Globin [Niveomyces insectorum RCEF 264]